MLKQHFHLTRVWSDYNKWFCVFLSCQSYILGLLELLSNDHELKITTKVLPTKVKKHLFVNTHELGLNEAVGCMDFAITFSVRAPSSINTVLIHIVALG